MKLSLAFAALCALPALASLDYSGDAERKEFSETIYVEENSPNYRPHHPHGPEPHRPHPVPHKPEEHHYPHKKPEYPHKKPECPHKKPECPHKKPEHHYEKPEHHHEKPESHKKEGQYKLTEQEVCEKLRSFAHQADKIYDRVKGLHCGHDANHCWLPVKKEIYELEFQLDFFDIAIDKSGINKCWSNRQEGKIACCYKTYAAALIRLLNIIHEKSKYLDGEADKFIITAINSIKAADYTFVYELVRRLQSEEYQKEIMKKQGAVDGSTPGSIREAFALFVSTPYITGDNFKGKQE